MFYGYHLMNVVNVMTVTICPAAARQILDR
jgi:hypothetical protein